MRRRAQVRRAETAQAIVDAADRLLCAHSFRDLTIADVMAEAGLGRTAFYRYFPDLEALVVSRLAEIRASLEWARDQWILEFGASPGPESDLLAAASAIAEVFRLHGPWLLACADAATVNPEADAAWRGLVDDFCASTLEGVEGLCAAGLCVLDDPAETTRALVLMSESYLLEAFGRGRDVTLERAAEVLAMIWRRTLFGAPAGTVMLQVSSRRTRAG
jgi:AcrR family transcriptional regulator